MEPAIERTLARYNATEGQAISVRCALHDYIARLERITSMEHPSDTVIALKFNLAEAKVLLEMLYHGEVVIP